MGRLSNYHRVIMERLDTGELELGVSKMAGASPQSIAFSRFWTTFPLLVATAYIAVPAVSYIVVPELARSGPPWWGFVVFAPVTFVAGVWIRRNRGMAKARRLASVDPLMFDRLWDEGALSLRLAGSAHVCMSPSDNYRWFVARNFLDDAMTHDD